MSNDEPATAPIPLADLVAQHDSLADEITAAIDGVIRSGGFILGPDVAAFEREFAELHGVKPAIGVGSVWLAIPRS